MPRRKSHLVIKITQPGTGWWLRLDLPRELDRNNYQVKVSASIRTGRVVNSTTLSRATATEIGRQIGKIIGGRW